MRFIKNIALLSFSLIFLSSCNLRSDDEIGKEIYSLFIDYVLENNKNELIDLFALNISSEIDEFETRVDELTNYVTGSFESSSYTPGTGAHISFDDFKQTRFLLIGSCELYTTDFKYFVTILYCSVDDYDSDNVGIWNLLIQKCINEDDNVISYSSSEEWLYKDTYRGITLI